MDPSFTRGGLQQWIAVARSNELNGIATLRLLLETCNVSETARQFETSQSAVSRILERMRKKFADPLLVKSADRMLLSKRAQTLIPLLDELLVANYRLYHESRIFNPALMTRTFLIGASDSTQAIITQPLLEIFQNQAPHLILQLEQIRVVNIAEILASGRFDLVLGFAPVDFGDSRSEAISCGDIVCLASADNTSARTRMNMAQLAKRDFIKVRPGGEGFLDASVDSLFQQEGYERSEMATLSSYLALPSILASTDLFCFVPKLLLPLLLQNGQLMKVELDFISPQYVMTMYWHNIAHTDPGQMWLRQNVAQTVAKYARGCQ